MSNDSLLTQSSRVALSAMLHDLGKFAERARIAEKDQKVGGEKRQAINEDLYCPTFKGQKTHKHAAFTALALDLILEDLPPLVGENPAPFGSLHDRAHADDSFINAAARHHCPETFLQWVVAAADRLASGFERESFDQYNQTPDDEKTFRNHYTIRLWPLLASLANPDGLGAEPKYRQPLLPLTPESLFPLSTGEVERKDKSQAQGEYRKLWDSFREGLRRIPREHQDNLSLWLDHFDSLWLTFTHAIPSATVGSKMAPIRPDVSLYDHSRTTAALAVALWRYFHDRNIPGEEALRALSSPREEDASTDRFLLVQGDFSGIQNFIFAEGGQTQTMKFAAKLLRGRSFYVSLLSEVACLRVLEELSLPPTSVVTNAAGKFLIVAPHTESVIKTLEKIQTTVIDPWFLEHTYGTSGINLAWHPASGRDFSMGSGEVSPFKDLMRKLFEDLERKKYQRFGLTRGLDPQVFSNYLDRFEQGACALDSRAPAEVTEKFVQMSRLSWDFILTGELLTQHGRLSILAEEATEASLTLPLLGYRVRFCEDVKDRAERERLIRWWDFSLPEPRQDGGGNFIWKGVARRNFNTYVPRLRRQDLDNPQFQKLDLAEIEEGGIKSFSMLAMEDRTADHDRSRGGTPSYKGIEALAVIKGDVDNLGMLIQNGFSAPNFSRMASLSRQINAFFTIYLPTLCQKEFPNTYTVFAGGDDFFLIGPWHSTILLAQRMREDFVRFVGGNPHVHFSAGMAVTKPGIPVRHMVEMAEENLEAAKSFVKESKSQNSKAANAKFMEDSKNAVTLFDQTVPWEKFTPLVAQTKNLEDLIGLYNLSSGYVYGLLNLSLMAEKVKSNPHNALWKSWFSYRTRRFLESAFRKGGTSKEEKERQITQAQKTLTESIGEGITTHRADYKIPLFIYLYKQRH